MAATDDVKTAIEALTGTTKTGAQLTAIGDAFAKLSLGRDRLVLRVKPIHFDGNDLPIPFDDLTAEQKAEVVKAAMRSFGRRVIYQSSFNDGLLTAEETAAANAETAASDFD